MKPLRFTSGRLRTAEGTPAAAWPRTGLLGDPVEHTLSPRLHAAALRARYERGEYAAIHVAASELAECLRQAQAAGVVGLNLTLPHKLAVLSLAAECDEGAQQIGAANTLVRAGVGWRAHNTDAPGLALALRRFAPASLWARAEHAAVVGAGGAARAAVAALTQLGFRRIDLLARQPERARWAQDRGCTVLPLHQGRVLRWDVLIQATPLGLRPTDPAPVDVLALHGDTFVVDLTYGVRPSRLIDGARDRGCGTLDGLPMLVAQAALAFALWFGGDPPMQSMAEAAGFAWS